MKEKKVNFIVIDDSKLDCFIAEKLIRNSGITNVRSFMDAREALQFITDDTEQGEHAAILLVDVQMPLMNGFEFVEAFEKLPAAVQKKYVVYALSSSSNENDISRMSSYKSVRKYLNKPLTMQLVTNLAESVS